MRFASVNLNGLRSKTDELAAAASHLNLTTICLQETKINPKTPKGNSLLPGYNTWRLDRTSNGGGVAVMSSLNGRRLKLKRGTIEAVTVALEVAPGDTVLKNMHF